MLVLLNHLLQQKNSGQVQNCCDAHSTRLRIGAMNRCRNGFSRAWAKTWPGLTWIFQLVFRNLSGHTGKDGVLIFVLFRNDGIKPTIWIRQVSNKRSWVQTQKEPHPAESAFTGPVLAVRCSLWPPCVFTKSSFNKDRASRSNLQPASHNYTHSNALCAIVLLQLTFLKLFS